MKIVKVLIKPTSNIHLKALGIRSKNTFKQIFIAMYIFSKKKIKSGIFPASYGVFHLIFGTLHVQFKRYVCTIRILILHMQEKKIFRYCRATYQKGKRENRLQTKHTRNIFFGIRHSPYKKLKPYFVIYNILR